MPTGFQAGAIVGQLILNKDKWNSAVKGVKVQTKSMGKWVKQNSAQFKKMGLAITAVGAVAVATFSKMVKDYVEVGDQIDKMTKRTGFSATALSELAHAADISGASLSDIEKSVKRMARTITDAGEGLESYLRPLKRIGLEVKDLQGLSPEQQFKDITEAIAGLEDPTLRAATAQEIFGRAGTTLLPLMAEGAEGLKNLREEAHRLGIVFDEAGAKRAADLKDRMTELKRAFQGISFAIVSDIIPVLTNLAKHFTDVFVNIRDNAKTFSNGIINFLKAIATGVEGLMLAWDGFQALIFEGASLITEHLRDMVAKLVVMFVVMEKLPIVGKKFKGATDFLWDSFKLLDAITEGYNETAEKHIDNMTETIIGFDHLIERLEAAKNAYQDLETETKKYGETIVATALPATKSIFDELMKQKGGLEEVAIFTTKTVRVVNEKHKEMMESFAQTYQQGIAGIMQTLKRWALGEIIKSLAAAKMPFFVKLAILAPTVALFEGVFSKIGKAAEGGLFHRRRVIEVAEREPERVVREREWQEMKRGGEGGQKTLTFAPTFNINTLDPYTAAEVTRNQIMPQMLEALQSRILLGEMQAALEIK